MPFEWDDEKNRHNIAKHGIDFEDVPPLFAAPEVLVTEDRRKDYGEARYVLIGLRRGACWHVTFTRRGERIRLISARLANKRERRDYARGKAHQVDPDC
jgi:uncharacterized protein